MNPKPKRGTTGLIQLQKVNPKKLETAKFMRSHMTFAERCFWNMVRRNQIVGLQFRRQQVIHGFIADFYCNQINLVVEIDGGIHATQASLRPSPKALGEGSRQAG